MNGQIRKLVEQALFESNCDDKRHIKITMDIFAQLMVKYVLDLLIKPLGNLFNHKINDKRTYIS